MQKVKIAIFDLGRFKQKVEITYTKKRGRFFFFQKVEHLRSVHLRSRVKSSNSHGQGLVKILKLVKERLGVGTFKISFQGRSHCFAFTMISGAVMHHVTAICVWLRNFATA
uniref:Uncharacterized protein n=1 Tax=Proboscia inermis TaxID=420281 RepID=A0A7S0GFW2_9STRA